ALRLWYALFTIPESTVSHARLLRSYILFARIGFALNEMETFSATKCCCNGFCCGHVELTRVSCAVTRKSSENCVGNRSSEQDDVCSLILHAGARRSSTRSDI